MKRYDRFVIRLLQYGIRFTPKRGRIYLSTQHTPKDIDQTLGAVEKVFSEFCAGKEEQ
jgi:glutamate-1-semialdehyde 2,1-aminomutase